MNLPSGICLCLTAPTVAEDLALVARYRRHVDLLELRADFLLPDEARRAAELARKVDLPVILTVRRQGDGGTFSGDERDRIQLLRRIVSGGFAFVDLEEDLAAPELDRSIREAGTRVIRSFHDRNGVPRDLARRMTVLARSAREIPKAAVFPRGSADLLVLLEAFAATDRIPKVLLGMGDYGFPTRVLAPRLGSLFCYSSPPQGLAASGHVDPETLDELYRYHRIRPATQVFGVIGNPVMHSLSPVIHNRGFGRLGTDAVYLPFLVDDLEPFFRVADLLGIRGFSVTIPHKVDVISRLQSRDNFVTAIGACNTVHRGADGKWEGSNTDAPGFLAPLLRAFGGRLPRGMRATVIGAGGAGRAVAHALAAEGATMLVLNRTPVRAQELAGEINARGAGIAQAAGLDESGVKLAGSFSDLIVQTTSVGMAGQENEDPLPGYRFSGRETVYDLVYVPEMTTFLNRAEAAGCRIIRGSQMLLAQAFEQFRVFTGHDYPRDAAQGVFPSVSGD